MIEHGVEQRTIATPNSRHLVLLDRFIERLIAMRETASPALLLSLMVFGVYWLAAGPVSYGVLRAKGLQRHAWAAFASVVCFFTVLCWGGAAALRPVGAQVAHFSVVDVHAEEPGARVRSWLSLFVARHGSVRVALGDSPGGENTLASPGWSDSAGHIGFVDPQRYVFNAAGPDAFEVPIRATAKQVTADYLGELDRDAGYPVGPVIVTPAPITLRNGWPSGTLTHGLPGELKNVRVLYCPGSGHQPWVWQPPSVAGGWAANQPLQLVPPKQAERLVRKGQLHTKPRQWKAEGYLGHLVAAKTGQTFDLHHTIESMVADSDVVQAVEMLTFYSALPPPDFVNTEFIDRSSTYARTQGRGLDATGRTVFGSVMVVGHLDASPLAAPVRVDGERVDSTGWTVVRWVCPVAGPGNLE